MQKKQIYHSIFKGICEEEMWKQSIRNENGDIQMSFLLYSAVIEFEDNENMIN